MEKTGDFEVDTRNGYYAWVSNERYKLKDQPLLLAQLPEYTWDADFEAFLREANVPEQYVGKIAYYAWQQSHSYGWSEVLNTSYDLIEIFR